MKLKAGVIYRVREKNQTFWKSVSHPAYEVFDESEAIVATLGVTSHAGSLPVVQVDLLDPRQSFEAKAIHRGVSGLFASFTISHGSQILCLVAPKTHLVDESALSEDEGRGYPAYLSTLTAEGRQLTSIDHNRMVAELRHPWRDTDREEKVLGSFALMDDSDLAAFAAAAVETIRDLSGQNVVI